jgi:hypothetical protein
MNNLILLCPTCHTIIDKAESDYTRETLLTWKTAHAQKISDAFDLTKFDQRPDAYEWLKPIRSQNRRIFETYGPMTDDRFNPESESTDMWHRHLRDLILPNNRLMLAFLDKNRHLLHDDELEILEDFRIHVSDFENRHLDEVPMAGGRRYPVGMEEIFYGD